MVFLHSNLLVLGPRDAWRILKGTDYLKHFFILFYCFSLRFQAILNLKDISD